MTTRTLQEIDSDLRVVHQQWVEATNTAEANRLMDKINALLDERLQHMKN
jgi:hypothetical protein